MLRKTWVCLLQIQPLSAPVLVSRAVWVCRCCGLSGSSLCCRHLLLQLAQSACDPCDESGSCGRPRNRRPALRWAQEARRSQGLFFWAGVGSCFPEVAGASARVAEGAGGRLHCQLSSPRPAAHRLAGTGSCGTGGPRCRGVRTPLMPLPYPETTGSIFLYAFLGSLFSAAHIFRTSCVRDR